MDSLGQRPEGRKAQGHTGSLGRVQHCEGMGTDRSQVLEGLNAARQIRDCLQTMKKTSERAHFQQGFPERSLWLLNRPTGTGLEAGKLRRGCYQAPGGV